MYNVILLTRNLYGSGLIDTSFDLQSGDSSSIPLQCSLWVVLGGTNWISTHLEIRSQDLLLVTLTKKSKPSHP